MKIENEKSPSNDTKALEIENDQLNNEISDLRKIIEIYG